MILKTEGLILRVLPYSRTSLMADCLTREAGRLWLLAKGAYRPRSPVLGQLDLFYTCEVVFYHKPGRVMVLKECSLLEPRIKLRSDWRACACASYVCGYISQVAPPGVAHDDLYDLLSSVLDALVVRGAAPGILGWFELAALKRLGLGPSLARCVLCGRDPASDGLKRLRLSSRQGGILCGRCAERENSGFTPVSAGTLALLRSWENAEDPSAAAVALPSIAQWNEVQTVFRDFSAYHLELPMRSRDLTCEWLGSLKRLYPDS